MTSRRLSDRVELCVDDEQPGFPENGLLVHRVEERTRPDPRLSESTHGFLRVERNVVVGPYYSGFPGYYAVPGYYPPYVAYEPGAYFRPRPYVYGGPEYLPGANWRDNWYDATRKKVHGFTLR